LKINKLNKDAVLKRAVSYVLLNKKSNFRVDNNGTGTVWFDDIRIKKGASEIIEESNYYPFGLKHKGYNNVISSNGNSTAQKKLYNGKEMQDELGLNWHDFGARNYDAAIGRWMNLDPLAEEFITYTPYNAMMNNPLSYIDPDGRFSTNVTENEDGTYTVAEGGDPNDGDNGIYVVDSNGNRTGKIIGESLTSHSFFDDKENAVVGAVIDPNSTEGQDFIDNEILKDNPGLLKYMMNATGGEHYDFKERDMEEALKEGKTELQHRYRGSKASNGKFGSARDFGNGGAGIVAGRAGVTWANTRLAFDALETAQYSSIKVIRFPAVMVVVNPRVESTTSQKAQKLGHKIGYSIYYKKIMEDARNGNLID
jgi:RHS repeat-associated protein